MQAPGKMRLLAGLARSQKLQWASEIGDGNCAKGQKFPACADPRKDAFGLGSGVLVAAPGRKREGRTTNDRRQKRIVRTPSRMACMAVGSALVERQASEEAELSPPNWALPSPPCTATSQKVLRPSGLKHSAGKPQAVARTAMSQKQSVAEGWCRASELQRSSLNCCVPTCGE